MLSRPNKNSAGFTLIEIMVSVGIFAMVAVTTIGALLYANRVNEQAQAIKLAMDNLNFALDTMTFDLRQRGVYYCVRDTDPPVLIPPGTSYENGQDCAAPAGGSGVVITIGDGTETKQFVYRRQTDPATGGGFLEFWETGITNNTPVRLTSDALDLKAVKFYVYNQEQDNAWPRILITVFGEALVGHQTHEFALETVVSKR